MKTKKSEKLQEKVVKSAVRVQQVKTNPIVLAHDLIVSKSLNNYKVQQT
jgi:hypothetical protein